MLAAIITVLAVILDQVSKYLVTQHIELHGSQAFIPKVLSFYHTRNTGAAFSMLSDHRWVFMVLSVISMAIIVHLLYKEYKRHPLMNVSLSMILGGGIGNMIDRFRLGYVVDFFKFEFVDFAIFNVADCFVTVGAVLLGVYIIFFEPKIDKRLKAEAAAKAASESAPLENAPASENIGDGSATEGSADETPEDDSENE